MKSKPLPLGHLTEKELKVLRKNAKSELKAIEKRIDDMIHDRTFYVYFRPMAKSPSGKASYWRNAGVFFLTPIKLSKEDAEKSMEKLRAERPDREYMVNTSRGAYKAGCDECDEWHGHHKEIIDEAWAAELKKNP
jgi:hypothetical protein